LCDETRLSVGRSVAGGWGERRDERRETTTTGVIADETTIGRVASYRVVDPCRVEFVFVFEFECPSASSSRRSSRARVHFARLSSKYASRARAFERASARGIGRDRVERVVRRAVVRGARGAVETDARGWWTRFD
jgi:hypothetical protein